MATANDLLIVNLEARVTQFEKAFARANGTATRTYTQITRGSTSMVGRVERDFARAAGNITNVAGQLRGAIGLALGAVSAGAAINLIRNMERLRASLETVTGSAEAAAKAFDLITKFAATTPFSVEQVTQAFIKLKALGLDPSEAALTSYGNTAAAMGKGLDQMIEAVADATTGEFERLKEFGIRASSEGDRVTFTFRNVATTVGKNAREIEAYLRGIGDVQFAGAMERQAKTLDGALSNLSDSSAALIDRIGQAGLGRAIADLAREMAGAAEEGDGLAVFLGQTLGVAVDEVTERFRLLNEVVKEFKNNGSVSGLNSLGKSVLQADPVTRQLLGDNLSDQEIALIEARRRAAELPLKRAALMAERESLSQTAADPTVAPEVAQLVAQRIERLDERIRQIEEAERQLGLILRAVPFRGPSVPAPPETAPPSGAAAPNEVAATAVPTSGGRSGESFPNAAVQEYVRQVVAAESGGDPNARNPASTATGLGQFIESTWLRLFQKSFPDRAQGMSDAAILALRRDADISRQMIEAYAAENADVLRQAGVSVDSAALHLSHFLGAGDAAKVLTAARGTPLQGLISSASIAANPTILGGSRTVDDAIAYAQRRANNTRVAAGDLTDQEEAAKRQADAIRGVVEQLRFESDQLGRNELQQAIAEAQRQANVAATSAEGQAIAALVTKNYELAEAQEAVKKAQEAAAESAAEFAGIARSAVGGLISDLRNGVAPAEALSNALDRVIDRLIEMALQQLITPQMFTGLGSLFAGGASVPGAALQLAGGGPVRGPGTATSDSIPARLSNGEYVVRASAAARNRALLDAINAGRMPEIPSVRLPSFRAAPSGGGGGARAGRDRGVIINNYSGQEARQETRTGPSGEELVVVTIGKALGQGRLDEPMRGRFGAAPQTMALD